MGKLKVIVRRPLSHYIIIAAYVLAPISNILLIRLLGNVSFASIFRNFFNGFGLFAGLWLITAPIIGIGFYFVNKTSWYLFIGHSCLIVIDYLVKWVFKPTYYIKTISGSHNALMLVGNLLLILIVGYIIQKDFRAPYFQAIQRHWRENIRIPIHHLVTMNGIKMNINDLSPGGCFVLKNGNDLPVDKEHDISFQSDLLNIICKGNIMRQTATGFGIMFKDLNPVQKKDIQRFLKKRFSLRQQVKINAQWVISGIIKDILLIDISKGGCFIATDVINIREGDTGVLKMDVNKKTHNIHCHITWINHKGEHNKPEGFGSSFRTKQKHLLKQILQEHGNLTFTR